MIPALRAEFLKITTTRTWWVLLIGALLLGGGYATLPAVVAVRDGLFPLTDPGILNSIGNGGNTIGRVLAAVLGILAIGNEYRHGTLAGTYLASPRRMRVLLAKAISSLAFGLIYGMASVLAGVVVAMIFVGRHGGSLDWGSAEWISSLLLGVVAVAVWALFGLGVGLLIENLVVAMTIGIALIAVVEPLIAALSYLRSWDQTLNILPTGATDALVGATSWILFASHDPLVWWQGGLVLAGWCLLLPYVGIVTTVRRDVPE